MCVLWRLLCLSCVYSSEVIGLALHVHTVYPQCTYVIPHIYTCTVDVHVRAHEHLYSVSIHCREVCLSEIYMYILLWPPFTIHEQLEI